MDTYAERLKYALKMRNKNQSDLARAINVKPQSIQYLCREGKKSVHTVAIANALNISATWLESGAGEMTCTTKNASNQHGIDEHRHNIKSNAIWLGYMDAWDNDTPIDDDEVALPFFREIELSAGAGRFEVIENHGAKLRFSKSTLKKQGVDISAAACVTVSGNSMEPNLPDGSTVGIDTAKKNVIDGKTYAIDHDGHLRIKTLYTMPGGKIRLRSFNREEWPDELVSPNEIKILGQVFWSSVLW